LRTISHGKNLIIILCLTCFLPFLAGSEPDKNSYHHISVELKGQAVNNWTVTPDIDNDGFNEFISQSGNKISIYQLIGKDKPDLKITGTFQIPENVFVYCFTKLPGEPAGCLLGITPDGVDAFAFTDGTFGKTPRNLLKITSDIFRGTSATPFLNNFIYGSIIVIPRLEKFTIAKYDAGAKQFNISQEINIPIRAAVKISDEITEEISSAVFIPVFYFMDMNNDSRDDFLVWFDEYLYLFLQDEKGAFAAPGNNQAAIDLSLSRRKMRDQELEYQIIPSIKDINNDKFPDILVSNGSKGINAVYLNRAGKNGIYFQEQKPDYVKNISGWIISQDLADINNDGLGDLIIVFMGKVGVTSGLRILLAHSINWEMDIYLGKKGKDGKLFYSNNPDYVRFMDIPFTFSLDPSLITVKTPFFLDFSHDLNKDNINDLMIKESASNRIFIYCGNTKTVFSASSDVTLALKAPVDFSSDDIPYGKPFVTDFNNDGIPDVIFYLQDFKGLDHFFEFFLSAKN